MHEPFDKINAAVEDCADDLAGCVVTPGGMTSPVARPTGRQAGSPSARPAETPGGAYRVEPAEAAATGLVASGKPPRDRLASRAELASSMASLGEARANDE